MSTGPVIPKFVKPAGWSPSFGTKAARAESWRRLWIKKTGWSLKPPVKHGRKDK